MSPSARVHAQTRGVDPGQLTGTGRGGRITKEDVLVGPVTNGQSGASGGLSPAQHQHHAVGKAAETSMCFPLLLSAFA